MRIPGLILTFILPTTLACQAALAAPTAFTDPTLFGAAAGNTRVVNFDSVLAGTTIPNGSTFDGVRFITPDLDTFGVSLEVRDDDPALSGSNYLGTDDAGVLQSADTFSMAFDPTHAFGLYVLTGDTLFDDDLQLTVGSFTASLLAASALAPLPDGSNVYFLGLVDAMSSFSQVQVSGFTPTAFTYNIDDITLGVAAVPAPAAPALLAAALLFIWRLAARSPRRRQSGSPTHCPYSWWKWRSFSSL